VDPFADFYDGLAELLGIVDAETEISAKGFHRFDPEGKGEFDGVQGVIVKRIEAGERRRYIRDSLLLKDPTPVLVFAAQDTFQRRRRCSVTSGQDRKHQADRKIPKADNGINGSLKSVQPFPCLLEHPANIVILGAVRFLIGEQLVKDILLLVLNLLKFYPVEFIWADDENILFHPCLLGKGVGQQSVDSKNCNCSLT